MVLCSLQGYFATGLRSDSAVIRVFHLQVLLRINPTKGGWCYFIVLLKGCSSLTIVVGFCQKIVRIISKV